MPYPQFISCKVEQPLQGEELQKKKTEIFTEISLQQAQKNHETYQLNELTSRENEELKPVKPVQMKIYQSNIYRKYLNWLHYDDDPSVQKKQLKEQQSYISVFVAYLTYPCCSQVHQPRHGNSIPYKTIWWIHKDRVQPKEFRNFIVRIKAQIFLEQFHQEPQSNLEEYGNPNILYKDFLQEHTHPFSHQLHQSYLTEQTRKVEFFQY